MPLTNIQSEWMSNASSGLCINVLLNLTVKFASWRVTSKMSYHRGWAWASMHCWFDVLSWHTNHGICHCLLFHGHSKQNFVQPFLRSRKALRLHTRWTKLHNEVRSWISGAYECHYAWTLPEANSTSVYDLTVQSVSSLPLSVMVLHNEVRSWISGAYECHYAWTLPEANSTSVHDLMVPSVSSLPLSVMVRSRIQQIHWCGVRWWRPLVF